MANTHMVVKIVLDFKGKWSLIMKHFAKKEWLNLYNKHTDIFNDNIAACNKLFDETYGKVDLMKDEKLMAVYNKFVADYMNPLMEKITTKHFKAITDPETGFFRMIQKNKPGSSMTFSMKVK